MKKIVTSLLAIVLCLTLVACGGSSEDSGKEANKEFDAFLETLPPKMISNTDSVLNSLFKDKEAFGFKDEIYEYDFYTKEDFQKLIDDQKAIYDELKTFKKDSLSNEQQLTYDVMEDYFSGDSDSTFDRDYYLATNYLDNVNGVPGNMPLSFYFFEFRNKSDIDSYLNLLKTSKEYYNQIADHEQERQNAGYGMPKSQIDAVIKQCDDYMAADNSFLVDSFKDKINDVEGLSEDEKQAYIAENDLYLKEDFAEAYVQLKNKLTSLEIKSQDGAGYAAYAGGKEYYAEMIENYTSFDSMKEYRSYLEKKADSLLDEMIEIYNENPKLLDKMANITFTKEKTPEGVLTELEEAVKEDFPKIRKVEYQMDIIPESMQSILSMAAAYSVSPFDDKDSKEKMILNSEYDQENFLTIAHEGFPGHMYQFQYYKDHEHPLIRDLMNYGGYSEGYANYVELYSAKYAQDAEVAEFYILNMQYTYVKLLLVDLAIHYDGVSREEGYAQLEEAYGTMGDEELKASFDQLLHSPALFAKYYGSGFRFADLREEMKEEMKSSYTDKKFHEALLKTGPAPYHIVDKYVRKWLVD